MRSASLFALVALAGAALAVPEGWHRSIEDGKEASRRSGKPVLAVLTWPPDV